MVEMVEIEEIIKSIKAGIIKAKIILLFKGVGFFNFKKILSVNLFTIGATTKTAGKATQNPLIPFLSQLSKKLLAEKPKIVNVITKDIIVAMMIDISKEKITVCLKFMRLRVNYILHMINE